jgi:DNA-binding beta-propeller fold protein YncE
MAGGSFESTVIAQRREAAQTPRFEVDPFWPKPLPNHWVLGSVTGVAVDSQDHIWIVHRGADSLGNNEKGAILTPPTGCCVPAPQVLEFDQAGNLVSHWGGPGQGFEWPQSTGGITVDHKGNVWIAGAGQAEAAARPTAAPAAGGARPSGPRPQDAHVIKFSRAGAFLLQIGHAGKVEGSDSKTGLNRPAAVRVDPAANEVYVADGFGNRRVVVFDAETGAYKRHWGAYGEKPDDASLGPYDPSAPPAKQFRTVSCAAVSKDGLVYVCDRQNDRIQVFQKDGKFLKEMAVSNTTLGDGSVWDIAFSNDPQQRFVYVADGHDKQIVVLQRDTLHVVSSFGDGGRMPGQFYAVGSIAVDSKGNVYTGETYEGKRVQKFVKKASSSR